MEEDLGEEQITSPGESSSESSSESTSKSASKSASKSSSKKTSNKKKTPIKIIVRGIAKFIALIYIFFFICLFLIFLLKVARIKYPSVYVNKSLIIVLCIFHLLLIINIVNTCFVSIRLLLNDDKKEHESKIILAFLFIFIILGALGLIFLCLVSFVPDPLLQNIGNSIGSKDMLLEMVNTVLGPFGDLYKIIFGNMKGALGATKALGAEALATEALGALGTGEALGASGAFTKALEAKALGAASLRKFVK